MSSPNSGSPPASSITVRQLAAGQKPFVDGEPKYWFDNSVSMTEFMHSLSILFPEGENFFVRAVLAYSRDPAVSNEESLKSEVKGFVSQEVHHASCHIHYNKVIASRYEHDMDAVSRFVKDLLSIVETRATFFDAKANSLAITCSLEHLTATLAELLLNTSAGRMALTKMSPSHRALWIYHAIEETEHKAVAFDVYKAVGGSYVNRVWKHVVATAIFLVVLLGIYARFMWDSGNLFNIFAHLNLANFLFISPGIFRLAVPIWCDYFRRDFHPWKKGEVNFTHRWDKIIHPGNIISTEELELQ